MIKGSDTKKSYVTWKDMLSPRLHTFFFIISEDIDLIMCYSDVAALFFSVYYTYQWNQNKIMQHGFFLKHSWKYCKILIMAENVSKYVPNLQYDI